MKNNNNIKTSGDTNEISLKIESIDYSEYICPKIPI